MIMTKGKDVFWGIYAAIIPYVFIKGSAYITWILNEYRSRTFDSAGPMMGIFAMAILMGIILASLAMHYLSKPIETSKAPKIGLIIGLVYCVVSSLYVPVFFISSMGFEILWNLYPTRGGETQLHIFLGFYVFLFVFYIKNHTFVKKEELMKGIEMEDKQDIFNM